MIRPLIYLIGITCGMLVVAGAGADGDIVQTLLAATSTGILFWSSFRDEPTPKG